MVNSIYEQLKNNIKQGERIDKPLINWFLLTFVLSWLTLGIALIYIFIKRIVRVDKYISRKIEYFNIIIDFITVEANERGLDDYENIIKTLKSRLQQFQDNHLPMMSYVIKTVIPVIVFCIIFILFVELINIYPIENEYIMTTMFGWYIFLYMCILFLYALFMIYIYKMNKIWVDIQQFEHSMYEEIDKAFIALKLKDNSLEFPINSSIKKDFVQYIGFGLITFGIWFLVWDYYVHTAPDKLYKTFHMAENNVLNIMSSCIRN